MEPPRIIQGGLESMVATWPLARAVARAGQLGVVAGTLLPVIVARRLQLGDPGGHLRRAFEHFPFPGMARRVWSELFVPGGKPADAPFDPIHQPRLDQGPSWVELTVLSGFAEVFLAREGHAGPVGVYFQPAAELPLLPTLYGALLALASHVLAPHRYAPALLTHLAELCQGRRADWELSVAGARAGESAACCFDPVQLSPVPPPPLPPPQVLVVGPSAAELASVATAPRGELVTGFIRHPARPAGFPDAEELAALRALGRPFWLSGLPASPEQFRAARKAGAAGLAVSAPFYYCAESELAPEWKRRVVERLLANEASPGPARLDVEFVPSPAEFSVPVVRWEGTASDPERFARRERLCDVGFLRQLYRREDGGVGYRCPGEPVECHVAKGGNRARSRAQPCLCNSLLAALGLGQLRPGQGAEAPLLPAGEDLRVLRRIPSRGAEFFSAAEVISYLLAEDSRAESVPPSAGEIRRPPPPESNPDEQRA